jgi:transcriptional regulator with XRE-family HTH domain
MDVAERIKQLRKERNMSSNKLAELCNVSQSVISKLENGHRVPDVPTLKKICEVFNITLADFFAPENLLEPMDDNLRELLCNAKNLNPQQIKTLSVFLKTLSGKNK